MLDCLWTVTVRSACHERAAQRPVTRFSALTRSPDLAADLGVDEGDVLTTDLHGGQHG